MTASRSETEYQVAASVKKTATTASPALWPYVATGCTSSVPVGSCRRCCWSQVSTRSRTPAAWPACAPAIALWSSACAIWWSAGGTASQTRSPTAPPSTTKWRRIPIDSGTWCRRSQSTPGRIAAASVTASSRRTRTLRTCQRPKASATTASAAAVAFATRTVESRSPVGSVRSGRRVGGDHQTGARAWRRREMLCGTTRPLLKRDRVRSAPKAKPPTCAKKATPPPFAEAEARPKFPSTSW